MIRVGVPKTLEILLSVVVVVAQLFELFGVVAQGFALGREVAIVGDCSTHLLPRNGFWRNRFDLAWSPLFEWKVEVTSQCLHRQSGGICLALCRVARNMGRYNERLCEVVAVDIRLVLPYIGYVGLIVAPCRLCRHALPS